MRNVMGALRGCGAVKFDFCNNLLSSVHTLPVISLRYVRLNIKTKILYCYYSETELYAECLLEQFCCSVSLTSIDDSKFTNIDDSKTTDHQQKSSTGLFIHSFRIFL